MKQWRTTAKTILASLMTLVLVLSLSSCGGKGVTKEVPGGTYREIPGISKQTKQISEVSPPEVIQELRQVLDVYQPQVAIASPQQDEVVQDNTVSVRFQVQDLPIFKDPQLDLGPHLHVILDNEPYIAVYDLNQPLVLKDLSPGTHTLRVFASRPWHESFKNEGAYAQTTFHIFTKTDDNNPDPTKPLLTYSRPKGNYGAEPILLDFYLTNAPLHLVAQENPNDEIPDWRIRCTINGESFVLDRWQPIYLKGFKPGKNWVKIEFLDEQGNPVKNLFNSTARVITYEPKGQDTLSKIVRGELKAADVGGIVDPNYKAKALTPAPSPSPTVKETPAPKLEEEKPTAPEVEITQPVEPSPNLPPTLPEVMESPLPEPETIMEAEPLVTPPAEIPAVEQEPQQPEQKRPRGFFNRRAAKTPTPAATLEPSPSLPPTLPEVMESPLPEPETTMEAEPLVTPPVEILPEVEPTPAVEQELQQPEKQRPRGFFNRRAAKTPTPPTTLEPSPSLPPTLPEIIETPTPEQTVPEVIQPQPEPSPEAEVNGETQEEPAATVNPAE